MKRQKAADKKLRPTVWSDIKHNPWLYGLCVPALLFFLLFSYIPMFGLYIAFVDYRPLEGIWGSEFIGIENFKAFFATDNWITVTGNTLFLNALFIFFTTLTSVIIAIMLSEMSNKWVKKITQSIVILPHFMSWTVVSMLSVAILASNGMVNQIITTFGADPVEFYNTPSVWPLILVLLRIWQGAGFGSIVYLATITGIDSSIYEAAAVDGASRFQCITKITLPLLKNTIIMLTIMSVGKIFNGDFGMIYAMVGSNSILYPTTDVIDTYLFRQLLENPSMGQTAAVGLVQSVLGLCFVLLCNKVANKWSPESALF
ncbi:MAG TPA: sugar ABC transporter permease [Candidatus Ornithomonoglobus merdipullorum]|uniref:Sugar ABC transporter permease n=1 Tax=Candidatus Ornithomonoglobus merdipullorum TaxID=2840895 RepID=A0A9D1SDS5_9FIRM|nr:sugar ABC transporter permease [Candidatus Ornithomonoglobus merdipullorum]